MLSYKYVNIHTSKFIGAICEEHRRIIDEYTSNGYRYVGFIPTSMTDYGKYKQLDLIFEKSE